MTAKTNDMREDESNHLYLSMQQVTQIRVVQRFDRLHWIGHLLEPTNMSGASRT